MGLNLYRLDENHNPVECEDYAKAFKGDRHVVPRETINGCDISTVFLTIDHSLSGGPPVLFETMIFGGPFDKHEYQTRCCTWDEALVMHETARQKVLALK